MSLLLFTQVFLLFLDDICNFQPLFQCLLGLALVMTHHHRNTHKDKKKDRHTRRQRERLLQGIINDRDREIQDLRRTCTKILSLNSCSSVPGQRQVGKASGLINRPDTSLRGEDPTSSGLRW